MTDEILIRMGLDARPLHTGLRGIRNTLQQFKGDLSSTVGKLGGVAGIVGTVIGTLSIAVAAIAKLGWSAMEYAGQISDMSDATGMATDTIQAFALRVSQSGGSVDDAQRAIAKFANEIKATGGNPEREFRKLMDRIAAAETPIRQLAIASEVFGEKMGVKVVNAMKEGSAAFDEFKKKSSGKILDEREVLVLDYIGDTIDNFKATLTTLGGKALAFLATPFSGPGIIEANLNKSNKPKGAGDKIVEDTKALAKELEKLNKARRDRDYEQHTEAQKADILAKEAATLQDKINKSANGSLEQTKLKVELMEKEKDLNAQLEKAHKAEEDFLKRKKDAQEKINEKKEKERQTLVAINKQLDTAAYALIDLQDAKRNRSKSSTLGELADTNIDRWTTGNMRGQILTARRVRWLEQRGKWLAQHGYEDESQKVFGNADKLRSGLTALTQDERTPFLELEKTSKQQAASLDELLMRAKADGIVVVPSA